MYISKEILAALDDAIEALESFSDRGIERAGQAIDTLNAFRTKAIKENNKRKPKIKQTK